MYTFVCNIENKFLRLSKMYTFLMYKLYSHEGR